MLEPLFKLKSQRAVLIIYHLVASLGVGSLSILVHDPEIYLSLNPFQIIIISISITAPVTAFFYLPILYLLQSSVDTQPTDAKTKESELAVFSIACYAQKEINSIHGNATVFVNAEYSPREFAKLLLITGTIDKETNKKIQAQFAKIGMPTLVSVDVMPPVKEYTDDEIKAICERNDVDGIVRVKITGQDKSNARALAQTLYNLEVTVVDLKSNMNAANFIGTSASMKMEKAIHDYFRAIMPELQQIINQ